MAAPNAAQKPSVLFATLFAEGHLTPALQICAQLVQHGFDVTITGLEDIRPKVEALGIHLEPLQGLVGSPALFRQIMAERSVGGSASDNVLVEIASVDMLPSEFDTVRSGLLRLNQRDPSRAIVILSDTMFSGTLAYKLLGNKGPPSGFRGRVPKTLGISVVPTMFTSLDSGPTCAALGFDPSERGRARNKLVADYMYRDGWDGRAIRARMDEVLRFYGVTRSLDELFGDHARLIRHNVLDAMFACHDVTLQMCTPSLEYPYSDLPRSVKFAGSLPIKPVPTDLTYPDWFAEIRTHGTRATGGSRSKRVVMVAQGTVELDYDLLVMPTIRAFAERPDVLVVAILCARGATLDSKLAELPQGRLPPNVHVVDHFPYDAVLEHADVFVNQGGYGGLQHVVANGVPLVQSGVRIDKPEVGLRAEWAGLGVYLWDAPPAPESIAKAVDKVLAGNYRQRALELKQEALQHKSLEVVEKEIMALAESYN